MFPELSLGCLSSGHGHLSMYRVSSFVRYMHMYVPFIMYCSMLFVVVFQVVYT